MVAECIVGPSDLTLSGSRAKEVAGFKEKTTSINHAQCACLMADFPVAMNAVETQVPESDRCEKASWGLLMQCNAGS